MKVRVLNQYRLVELRGYVLCCLCCLCTSVFFCDVRAFCLSTEQEVHAVTEFCCTLHRSCIFFVGQARGASRPRVRPGQTLVRGCLCLLAPEPMPGVGGLALPATVERDRLGSVGSGPMHRSSALVGLVGDCLLLSVRGVGIAFCRPSARVLCRSGTSPLLGAAGR